MARGRDWESVETSDRTVNGERSIVETILLPLEYRCSPMVFATKMHSIPPPTLPFIGKIIRVTPRYAPFSRWRFVIFRDERNREGRARRLSSNDDVYVGVESLWNTPGLRFLIKSQPAEISRNLPWTLRRDSLSTVPFSSRNFTEKRVSIARVDN